MGKLYIFGNGLDLHYGLKTTPQDFKKYLACKNIYNESGDASEIFEGYHVLWSNFEQDIASIDLEELENNCVKRPDYLSEHEYDRDGVITNTKMYLSSLKNAIFDSLSDMVKAAEQDIQNLSLDDNWVFEREDVILTFNFTSTIEKISNVSGVPILHIHGFLKKSLPLILGYKVPLTNYNYLKFSNLEFGDYYMEKQLCLIKDFYQSLQKNMQFKLLELFLIGARNIDEVIVYGHSLGEVDVPYFEIVENFLKPRIWKVSYHDERDAVLFNKNHLSFSYKIITFKW